MPRLHLSCLLLASAFLAGNGLAAPPGDAAATAHATHATHAGHAAAQHEHAEHAHAAPAQAAVAPPGGWATDAPLREGMARVKAALSDLEHHEMGHLPEAMARERAHDVSEAVRFMFANCRLEPEPDQALHGILVPLLAASQRLEKDAADVKAVAAMREAVAPYGRDFDDAAWRGKAGASEHAH